MGEFRLIRALIKKVENYLESSKTLESTVALLFLQLITTTSENSIVHTFKIPLKNF